VDRDGIVVRVIRYTLADPQRVGHGEVHILITNLLDEDLYPANEPGAAASRIAINSSHTLSDVACVFDAALAIISLVAVPTFSKVYRQCTTEHECRALRTTCA
jgi:hypothetical protein